MPRRRIASRRSRGVAAPGAAQPMPIEQPGRSTDRVMDRRRCAGALDEPAAGQVRLAAAAAFHWL
jgi:hypothetical protein